MAQWFKKWKTNGKYLTNFGSSEQITFIWNMVSRQYQSKCTVYISWAQLSVIVPGNKTSRSKEEAEDAASSQWLFARFEGTRFTDFRRLYYKVDTYINCTPSTGDGGVMAQRWRIVDVMALLTWWRSGGALLMCGGCARDGMTAAKLVYIYWPKCIFLRENFFPWDSNIRPSHLR